MQELILVVTSVGMLAFFGLLIASVARMAASDTVRGWRSLRPWQRWGVFIIAGVIALAGRAWLVAMTAGFSYPPAVSPALVDAAIWLHTAVFVVVGPAFYLHLLGLRETMRASK